MVIANQNRQVPLSPSDVVPKYIEFLDRNGREWGIVRDVFIDSADQATKTELMKYKRKHGCLYNFFDSYKKVTILDRINLMLGWFQKVQYLVLEHCTEHIRELEIYSWQEEKDIPEDANDHTINGSQYGWIPYREIIGTGE